MKVNKSWGLISWSFKHRTVTIVVYNDTTDREDWVKVMTYALAMR